MRLPALLALAALALAGEALPPPMPSLPPEPRSLQLTPGKGETPRSEAPQGGPELSAEVQSLRHALDRVRASLVAGTAGGAQPGDAAEPAHPAEPAAPVGEPRHGKLFGEALVLQPASGGGELITADLAHETADSVLVQLAGLVDASLDEKRPTALARRIDLHVRAVPFPDALDRLLGQVGLRWREEGSGKARRLIVETAASGVDDRARRARSALERVANGQSGPAAAEAMWRIAAEDQAARRNAAALRGFAGVVDRYGGSGDPAVAHWVQLASRGAGEAMLALGAWPDARIAFRAWLARADETDPDGARILLLSAQASRNIAADRSDPGAYDEAVDDLHRLLERYGKDPRAAAAVAAARYAIGELLFAAGTQTVSLAGVSADVPPEAQARFREAESQIRRWLQSTGRGEDQATDQVAYWLAECAFYLGRSEDARAGYERLHRRWKSGLTDPQAPAEVYPTAAFRAGECWLRRPQPDHIRALFAFLRARQDFPHGAIEPYLLVRISQCYAELEAEDQAVAALYELLRNDQANDARPGRQQLDQLLGELVGKLGEYPGPVRARVLFYIARAQWLHARRDRTDQVASARQAAMTYRRVLDEGPPVELRQSARLGMARAMLLAGDDVHGEEELRRLLRDPTTGPRDREYAAQVLGEHLKAKGRLQEAIQAFRGEVGE